MQEILDAMNGYSLRLSLPFLPPPPKQRLPPKRACAYLLYRYAAPECPTATTTADTTEIATQVTTSSSSSASPSSVKGRSALSSRSKQQQYPRPRLSNLSADCIASFMLPCETVVVASLSHVATLKLFVHDISVHHVVAMAEELPGGEIASIASLPGCHLNTSNNNAGVTRSCAVAAFGPGIAAFSIPRLRLLETFDGAGHSDAALCIDTTRDGQHMATGGRDAAVIYWSRAEGPLRYIMGHTDWVRFVKFYSYGELPRRQLLFTASDDGTVVLWDPTKGERLTAIDFNGRSIHAFDAMDSDTTVHVGSDRSHSISSNSGSRSSYHTQQSQQQKSSVISVAVALEGSAIHFYEIVAPLDAMGHHHRRTQSTSSSLGMHGSHTSYPGSAGGGLGTGGGRSASVLSIDDATHVSAEQQQQHPSSSSSAPQTESFSLVPHGTMESPHRGTLTVLRFTPNREWLLTAAEDETIAVSSIQDRVVLWRSTSLVSKRRCISFMNTIACVRVVACPPQFSLLIVCACSSDGDVLLWVIDPRDGRATYERKVQLQIGPLLSLDLVPSPINFG